jgi:pimeloyl-ACP methyl ester carboxylesterase
MIATEKRRVRVPSGELAVVEAGDPEAPPVVLLSGGFTSSYLWRHLVPLLAPWMRVLAPDLLGSGDSDSPEGADLRLPAHASDVRALLGALGIERFAVAGHGRGAGIAQLLAVDGGVEALVLVDAVAFDAWPSPRIEELRSRLSEVDDAFIRSWLEGFFREGMGHPERLSEADLEEYRRPFAGPDGAERFVRIAGALDGAGLVDLEPRLTELEIPAFVLWGRTTRSCRPSSPNAWATRLPWAAVALLPGCGHFLLEDAPETVAPLIVQWLRTQYLRVPLAHEHEEGAVTVELGRRPPEEDRW